MDNKVKKKKKEQIFYYYLFIIIKQANNLIPCKLSTEQSYKLNKFNKILNVEQSYKNRFSLLSNS